MITREQCRAARGLLGWTQQDLANASGMSKTAINNFERGTTDIKVESHQSIRRAFEGQDIAFVGNYGVHKVVDTVKILKGEDVLPQLWDDIFETMRDDGGEALILNVDEKRSEELGQGALNTHLERLRKGKITERLLSCRGDRYFLQPVEYYRWVSKDAFAAGMTTFLYKGKVALQLWNEAMIIIINSNEAYNAEKQRFEFLWDRAEIPQV